MWDQGRSPAGYGIEPFERVEGKASASSPHRRCYGWESPGRGVGTPKRRGVSLGESPSWTGMEGMTSEKRLPAFPGLLARTGPEWEIRWAHESEPSAQ